MKRSIARRFLILALALPLVACGDDSTGPSNVEIEGSWRFTFDNITGESLLGEAVSCDTESIEFAMTQTGTTFSGVQVGNVILTCTADGALLVEGLVAGLTIVNGQVSGSAVTFGFATVTFDVGLLSGQHIATVSGTSMGGTAQWIVTAENLTLLLTGELTAVRL